MSRISGNNFTLGETKKLQAKLHNNEAKIVEQPLDIKSVYADGKLSRQIGLSFKGNLSANLFNIKDFDGKIISKNDPRYEILKDIVIGKYTSSGINSSQAQQIAYFLEQDKVEELKIVLNQNFERNKNVHRFNIKDIEGILNTINDENKTIFRNLIKSKYIGSESFRFGSDQIQSILKLTTQENNQFLEKILDKKTQSARNYFFEPDEIVASISKINDFTLMHADKILNLKTSDGDAKFEAFEFSDVLNNISPENINDFYNLSKIDDFNGNEIASSLKFIGNNSDKVVDFVIQSNQSPAINGNVGKIFECVNNDSLKDLQSLLKKFNTGELTEISFGCFLRLIETGIIDQLPEFEKLLTENKLEFRHLNKILNGTTFFGEQYSPINKYNAPYLLPLLKAKAENSSDNRFDINQITRILDKTNRQNTKILDYLLNEKNIDNNNYRFTPINVITLLDKSCNSNLNELKTLCDTRKSTNSGYLYTNDEINDFAKLIKADVPVNKILKGCVLKDLSEYEASNLLKYYRKEETSLPRSFANFTNSTLIKYSPNDVELLKNKISRSLSKNLLNRIKNNTIVSDKNLLQKSLIGLENSIKNTEFDVNTKIELSYSRESFLKDIIKIVEPLKANDKRLALQFFDINIENNKLHGFPFIRKNYQEKLNRSKMKSKDPYQLELTINKLKEPVKNFVLNNKVSLPQNKEMEKALNDFTKSFPEWLTTIGRKQHSFHKYTVDIHILKTLKNFVEDPNYNNLKPEDKKIAILFVLLHDIAKREELEDHDHAGKSAKIAYQMLKCADFKDRDLERITGLIKNHEWVGDLELSQKNETLLKDYAFEFRKSGDFDIASIFAKADLEASGNTEFYKENKDNYLKYKNAFDALIDKFNTTGIYVPQTRIPKASEIKIDNHTTKTLNIFDETNNTFIFIKNADNLEKLGFDKGTKRSNFNVITHFVTPNNYNITRDIDYASLENNNGVFSTTYINPKDTSSFFNYKFGFIFDAEPENIGLAYNENLGTGKEKNVDDFKSYLLDNDIKELNSRNYFSNIVKAIIKKHKNLSSKQYADIYKELADKKAITDIKDPEIAEIINKAVKKSLQSNIYHNELVVYAPKPRAIISLERPENIPKHLRKYAEEHDLPIIIL